jgi:hypothetical protein
MSQLTRRTIMSTAAAAGAFAPAITLSIAEAAAPLTGTQAPGFYRYKVGDYEVTAVTDGANTFPLPDGFVANVKKRSVQPWPPPIGTPRP